MQQSKDRVTVLVLLGVIAAALVALGNPTVRLVVGLVPAAILGMRALRRPEVEGRAEASALPGGSDRRSDLTVREKIHELLVLIRDFYTTCHMVAVGQLEPSKAKAKAQVVERQLDEMMTEMLRRIEEEEEAS